MTILATKTCVTCTKPCYPTERLMVSDLWVHKAGCMKCSACSATLSLNSVYVAPSPSDPNRKLLWCAKDVPKMVHTSVVDSIALKTAMNAPKCTSTPAAVFAKSKSQGKTLRFKGLTLRSKSIAQGLNAPKPEYSNGRQQAQQIFVGHVGAGLDSWDIAHAIAVQSQVRSPIRSHPAIHAQNTGSNAATALSAQTTGTISPDEQQKGLEGEISSAKTGEEGISIEPDLVKNLIRVFQLDSMDAVEITPTDDIVEDETIIVPDVLFDFADQEPPNITSSSLVSGLTPGPWTSIAPHNEDTESFLDALPGTIGRSAFYSTLRPSSFSLPPLPASTASSISTTSNMSGLASTAASQCGTFRANGMGSFRSTLTMRTLGTIGSKRGTLTLARIKGTLRRPALQGLFQPPGLEVEQVDAEFGPDDEGEGEEEDEIGFASPKKGKWGLELPVVPCVPANTPIKSPYAVTSRPALPSDGDLARMLKGRSSSAIKDGADMDAFTNSGSVRGTSLLKALLPLAAHLVPLPDDDDTDGDDAHIGDGGYFGKGVMDTAGIKYVGEENAEQAILESLEMGGLELIMMFEEEAEPLPVSSGIFL